MIINLHEYLKNNVYPGRGIAIGRTPCGHKIRVAYWIMGRSENSRNRVFVEDGAGIRTQAFDPSKLADPSLIIYAPVRVLDGTTIVTNGDQTDTVYDFMKEGKSFEEALRTRTFEPDGPNWTPRISAIINKENYKMSILRSADGNAESTERMFFEYINAEKGFGHFISTYKEDGNPIPSFDGTPLKFALECEPFDDFTNRIWESLNEANKVSLFTREINIETQETNTRIINKNK